MSWINILLTVIVIVMLWGLFAFGNWSFNPGDWTTGSRIWCGLLVLFLGSRALTMD